MTSTILIPHPEFAIFVIQQAHHVPAFMAGLLVALGYLLASVFHKSK